ncbi:MAG: zinc ribbon domain-containing protein [Schaedlerella sp.]|nr:zinc ribbon domain-containing protein [Schaedlerella sp.]
MYCENCGKRIADDSAFCEYCGNSLTNEVVSKDKGSKVMTWIIVFLIVLLLLAGIGIFVYLRGVLKVEDADENERKRNRSSKEFVIDEQQDEAKEEKDSEKETEKDTMEKLEELDKEEITIEEFEETEAGPYGDPYVDFSGLNVENEVVRIRTIYNEIQANVESYNTQILQTSTCYTSPNGIYKKYIVPQNANGINYEQWYFSENGQLIFAFYYNGQIEERFYFYQDKIFRWIDSSKITRDKDINNPNWINWENTVKSAWMNL